MEVFLHDENEEASVNKHKIIDARARNIEAATAGHWEIKKDEEMMKIDLAVTYATTLMALKLKCTTTDDGYQFRDKLEMSFVERPELFTPPPDEAFTRNVRRRLTTSQTISPANAARLIGTFGENFRPADILGSHDTSDITTLPIRRIFDRFRNLLTDNVERDFVSQTSLGKRPPSTTSFPYAYAEGGGAPPATNQTISIDRNIRRRLTTTPSHNTVDATALLAPSKLHVHTAVDGTACIFLTPGLLMIPLYGDDDLTTTKFIQAEVECSSSPIFTCSDSCPNGHMISPLKPIKGAVAGTI
ncbi:hypothetical protein Tco_1068947 [Tanacetum coccineum]|uniref:Uncharacterized protein n=1 Tax=Tanacetum coccineum TaxID=301880 RepID=A0ABQ5HH33_9ASTR